MLSFEAQGRIGEGNAWGGQARQRFPSRTLGHQPPTPFLPCPLQASKLKARLTLMEGWLQGSNCGRPWGPLDILQGEAPRGDIYKGHPLLQGTVGEQSGRLGGKGRGLAGQMPPVEPFSLTSVGFTPRRIHLLGEPV